MTRLLQLLALGLALAGAGYGLLSAATGWAYSDDSSPTTVAGILLLALGGVVVLTAVIALGVRLGLDATPHSRTSDRPARPLRR